MKVCKRCKKAKLESAFYRFSIKGMEHYCKACYKLSRDEQQQTPLAKRIASFVDGLMAIEAKRIASNVDKLMATEDWRNCG